MKKLNEDRSLASLEIKDESFADTENRWDIEDDEDDLSEEKINYYLVPGNEKIVFIKVGAGGSERGYNDKYVKMAERIHERIGATVICASNPTEPVCNTSDAEEIRSVVDKMGFKHFELYLLGTSDGAYLNLKLANQFSETVEWIGINASFVSMSDLEKRLKAQPNVSKLMIYGTEDDDFDEIVPALSKICCDNFALEFVEGADHSFIDMLDEFIALADYVCR